jgi:hypothetical protein
MKSSPVTHSLLPWQLALHPPLGGFIGLQARVCLCIVLCLKSGYLAVTFCDLQSHHCEKNSCQGSSLWPAAVSSRIVWGVKHCHGFQQGCNNSMYIHELLCCPANLRVCSLSNYGLNCLSKTQETRIGCNQGFFLQIPQVGPLVRIHTIVTTDHFARGHPNVSPTYNIRDIRKVNLSSPCFKASFHPLTPPLGYLQSKEILLNLSMKCWISACNAQGSRGIIVAVQVGAVKIYVAAVEALRKKRKTGWNSVNHQNNVLFSSFFKNLTLCMTKLRVLVPSFRDSTDISNILI